MLCKYCGREAKANGLIGLVAGGTTTCPPSPSKKHVGSASSQLTCIYCGQTVRANGNIGLTTAQTLCPPSPTKKHELA